MTIKVSKDGNTFFDIDDSEDSLAAAKEKGYQEYLPVTKDGKDIYNIVATPDSLKAAIAKGYKDPAMFKFQNKTDSDTADHGSLDATIRGAAQGASMGFADELSGLAGAIVNPTNSDKGFVDRYRDSRDYARSRDASADDKHGVAYNVANLAGGIAAGVIAPGAGNLANSVGQGALYGLGGSDADLTKGDVQGAAIDSAIGGGVGAVGHGLAKGVGAILSGEAAPIAKAVIRGATDGAKNETGSTLGLLGGGIGAVKGTLVGGPLGGIGGYGAGSKIGGAVTGILKELKASGGTSSEFKGIAQTARQVLRSGENGSIGSYSDDSAVLAALTQDGENPVKKWFAEKAAVLNPGQGSAEDYLKLLNMNSADRQAARSFNPREAATALKPDVEELQNLFEQSRSDRYGQLQNQARAAFENKHVAPVVDNLETAIADANRLNSTKGVSGLLADVHGIITEGNGITGQGLVAGPAAEAAPQEMFNRLQQSRQLLDGKIKWANREGDSQTEKLLKGVRDSIDGALKTSPDKIEGDALWRSSKNIEDKFFGATEFGKKGNVDIDEGKLSRLLGGTDQAKRFQASLAEAKAYAANENLSPEFRQKMADVVANIEQKVGIADNQRALGSFRFKNGPSSPSIERFQSSSNGNSLLKDAVNAPSGFLNSADELNKLVQQRTGQSFQDLSADKKVAAAKYWAWIKKNPDASQTQMERIWNRTVGGN